MNKYYKIYRKIKKYNKIVIARHVGPDPDCLGSSIGLRDAILNKFPKKEVYAVGNPASTYLINFSRKLLFSIQPPTYTS